MTDCLIIGFNDFSFNEYVGRVRAMGKDSGAFRDLQLAFFEHDGRMYRALDAMTEFHYLDKREPHQPFHNVDFLWPTILYLGTFLHRRGYTFDYINLFQFEKEQLKQKLASDDLLLVAITTTLYVIPYPITEIVSFIRKCNPRVKIIVGGPFVGNQTLHQDRATVDLLFKHLGADIYVDCSEGEQALVAVLSTLKAGHSLSAARIPNVAYRNGNGFDIGVKQDESNPLEENTVDYGLFPVRDIGQFVSIRTAKSCPFACAFCGFPERGGAYQYLSVELVEKELNALRDLGTVTTVTILDDTFNVPKGRFKEILRMMIRNKYPFKWNSFYRCDHGDKEAIELMAEAGCEGVFLGVESGSAPILKAMNKSARPEHYYEAIPSLKKVGIETYASLVIGFPGETYNTVEETMQFIETAAPDFYRAQLWYADPATPIMRECDKYEIRGSGFKWSHRTMNCHEASDLVEKMFLAIENSIWMPQSGFEQWSTYYLQRRGMTMDQVKTFVKGFNAAIRENLLFPNQQRIQADRLQRLKWSCQFDRAESRPASNEILTGGTYRAAEKFWFAQFQDSPTALNSKQIEDDFREDEVRRRMPVPLDPSVVRRFCSKNSCEPYELALVSLLVLLSRIKGVDDVTLLVVLEDQASAFPFRSQVRKEFTFRSYLAEVRRQLAAASSHHSYGLHIVTNPYRMAQAGLQPLHFDVSFILRRDDARQPETTFKKIMRSYPELERELRLGMLVQQSDITPYIFLDHDRRWFRKPTVDTLVKDFGAILARVLQKPKSPFGDTAAEVTRHHRVFTETLGSPSGKTAR